MAVITGNARSNTITGTQASDIISGLDGNDDLRGRGGDDFISGGPGIDQFNGGPGNDIFFIDPEDRPINGGTGTDVVILAAGGDNFVFGPSSMSHVEGIQDVPGATRTSVTMDAGVFATTDGNTFRFAMGDGQDSVTLIDDGHLQLTGGELVYDSRVHLQFQGVETVTVVDQNGGNHVLSSQVTQPGSLAVGFAGPGSVAAKSAAAFAFSHDSNLINHDDLRPIADLLNQFHAEGNNTGISSADINQTAQIIQKAIGHGDVSQIGNILQNATSASGNVDQNAAIQQVAQATGGNVNQVASIVQKAVDFALPGQDSGTGGGTGTGTGNTSQTAGIDQSASGATGTTSQNAGIDQQAMNTGGDVTQNASINQTAGSGGDLFLMH